MPDATFITTRASLLIYENGTRPVIICKSHQSVLMIESDIRTSRTVIANAHTSVAAVIGGIQLLSTSGSKKSTSEKVVSACHCNAHIDILGRMFYLRKADLVPEPSIAMIPLPLW